MRESTKMFTTCLRNRIVQKECFSTFKIYKCYLCNVDLSDEFGSVLDHIVSNAHSVRINSIDQTVKESESGILSHIPHWGQKKIVESCVTIGDEPSTFFCHICNCKISDSSKTLDHTDSFLHKEKWVQDQSANKSTHSNVEHDPPDVIKICQSPDLNNCFSNVSAKLDRHMSCISRDKDLYFCDICSCSIQGAKSTWAHISGKRHRASIKATELVKNETNENDTDALTEKDSMLLVRIGSVIADICFCTLCKIYLMDPLIVQCHVMVHLHQEIDFPPFVDIVEFTSSQSGTISTTCLLCKFSSSDSSRFHDHLKSLQHLDNLKIFSHLKDDVVSERLKNLTIDKTSLKFHHDEDIIKAFFCNACNVPVSGIIQNVDQHKIEARHRDNVVEYLKVKTEVDSNPPRVNYSRLYVCFVCDLSFLTPGRLLEHYNEKDHKRKMGNFQKIHQDSSISFTVLKKEPSFHCVSCDDKFSTLKKTVEHVLGNKHGMKSPNLKQESEPITGDNIIGSCVDRMGQNNISPLQSGIVPETNIKLKKNQRESGDNYIEPSESELTKSTQTSVHDCEYPVLPGGNIIPSSHENLMDYCIDPRKMNIHNIGTGLIQMISAGLELTVSDNNAERYCFACQITLPADQPTLFAHVQNPSHISNSCDLKLENQKRDDESSNYFSSLNLAKLCMKKISNNLVYCYLCNIEIKHDNQDIVLHYKTAKHVRKSIDHRKGTDNLRAEFLMIYKNAWYYAELFACEICKIEYHSDIKLVEHFATYQHISNVSKHGQTKLSLNICPVCFQYWFGKLDSFSLHCEGELHKSILKKEDDNNSSLREGLNCQELFNDLNELVHSFVKESGVVDSDKDRELEILIALEDTVRNSYPKAQAYSFGSRIEHTGTAGSDINIFLDCENQNYLSNCTDEKIRSYLANVCKDLRNEAGIWAVTEIMAETKVPIIKLLHEPTGLDCEIYFWNGLCVEKSKLVGCYNAASPICRQLILYLKNWMKSCRCLSGSNYTIAQIVSWYVIFYLQVEGILPSVSELMRGCSESKIIDGWKCGYTRVIPSVSHNLTFRHHLQNFFSYYSDFDYQSSVACPYLGRLIRKYEFAHIDQLPKEMEIYKFRASANVSEIFRFDSPMCIQDPIDLSQNMTKHICKAELRLFRQYCYESAQILSLVN